VRKGASALRIAFATVAWPDVRSASTTGPFEVALQQCCFVWVVERELDVAVVGGCETGLLYERLERPGA
jgi:hypothetical protein